MKILVISSNLIGDNILSSGVLQHFLKTYSNTKFTLITGPTAYQLYEHFPNLEQKIIIKKKKYNLHWFIILQKCLFKKWDIVIDFRSSLLSYFLVKKKKYIFVKNNKNFHLEQLNQLFKFSCLNLKIFSSDKENKVAEKYIYKNYKHVVICPGGNWKPKIWSVENYNKLIKKILIKYNQVKFILVGSSNEEKNLFKDIVKEIDNEHLINLMGKSLTLTSAFMKKSNLFVGNDSGLMHLSVSSSLTTIALFGPTNDKIYGHKGDSSFIIRTTESYENLRNNIIDENKSYMDSIKVDDILDVIQKNKLL